MQTPRRKELASEIMDWFAEDTGVSGGHRQPRRYLWTDAFAVCNFLGLYLEGGAAKYLQLAVDLVEQVHETLGKHCSDDARNGWISGLDEDEGQAHPTIGGLRIGKKLAERQPGEPFDEHLEWERDGQYYHYLTKWAHALCQMSAVTGNHDYARWAGELALAMHRGFFHQEGPSASKRLFWKMSVDLSRPLVGSMGHHDPLDGLVTFNETYHHLGADRVGELSREISELAEMCRHANWASGDPLGIGGLLFDAYRILQMDALTGENLSKGLVHDILQASASGLQYFLGQDHLNAPAERRLAFRELGLSIGLHAVPRMIALLGDVPELDTDGELAGELNGLMAVISTTSLIEAFWLEPTNQHVASWQGHQDINKVMLAASLLPGGYLDLQSGSPGAIQATAAQQR